LSELNPRIGGRLRKPERRTPPFEGGQDFEGKRMKKLIISDG
jgi:hypothetical protein